VPKFKLKIMTDREEDIIEAVGEYIEKKFGDKAYSKENYTEEVQEYYDELVARTEEAYNERFVLSSMLLNKLIKEVAQEMATGQRSIGTLKYHLGL
jgi:hypothetical protein